jgi:hypothetical protein
LPAVLAVGDTETWIRHGRQLPNDGHLVFAEFHQVTAELLSRLSPPLILSPLLARNFDCIDLAEVLWSLGYRGRYRAIDPSLPNPALIRREVRMLVPGLDFDVTTLT